MTSSTGSVRLIAVIATIATLAAVALAAILMRLWTTERQTTNQLRVVFTAQAPILAQANRDERQSDAELAKTVAKISREKKASGGPQEIVKRLPEAFGDLPHPLSVTVAPGDSGGSADSAPPAVITVPQDDLKPLFDHLENCRVCEEQLAGAQRDLRDERAKAAALTAERDAALKAAHGGGFWPRLRTGAKWFAIGATLGAVAASAAHH